MALDQQPICLCIVRTQLRRFLIFLKIRRVVALFFFLPLCKKLRQEFLRTLHAGSVWQQTGHIDTALVKLLLRFQPFLRHNLQKIRFAALRVDAQRLFDQRLRLFPLLLRAAHLRTLEKALFCCRALDLYRTALYLHLAGDLDRALDLYRAPDLLNFCLGPLGGILHAARIALEDAAGLADQLSAADLTFQLRRHLQILLLPSAVRAEVCHNFLRAAIRADPAVFFFRFPCAAVGAELAQNIFCAAFRASPAA